jgi:hypothetical protein
MKTIKVRAQGFPHMAFSEAKAGDVWFLTIHGCNYPPELQDHPPRYRLLEDARGGGLHTECELIDDWPDAPEYWPPGSEPAATRVKKTTSAANQGRKSA